MDKHIFDILGIGSREDSYSDLIAEAFRESHEFRVRLLNQLSETYSDDWKVQVRVNVPVVIPGGRKRDIPDLIFSSESLNRIIVLENKIFSGEGWEQTIRYTEKSFKEQLAQEETIRLNNPEFSFYYLTLDGSTPASNEFKSISYDTVILSAIPPIIVNSQSCKLDLLLEELRERIEEYKNWDNPNPNEKVLDYLNNTRRLIDAKRTFFKATQDIFQFDRNNYYYDYGVTANRGSAFIPLVLFRKTSWIGNKYVVGDAGDGGICRHIHYEFQWDTRKDWENITLYLHYEMNPYHTQKEMDAIEDREFINEYILQRERFFKKVQQMNPDLWNIDKTVLRIGYATFDKQCTFEETREKVHKLLLTMTPIIDNYLAD